MNQIWKSAPGFPDYEVSNLGQVRRATPGENTTVGHVLKGYLDKNGYHCILLQRTPAKPKHVKVHRLVVQAFIGPIPEGMQVNHCNGIKADNKDSNLEIITPSGNAYHAFRVLGRKMHRIRAKGENHGNATLKENDVRLIRKLYANGITQVVLAKRFHTKQNNISRIVRLEAWKHVA